MPSVELRNALVAIRWSTDYLLKTVAQLGRIVVQVRLIGNLFMMHIVVVEPLLVSENK
ncbi:putative cellulase [Helianthus anomalus]